jgi:hypothetical protein
LCCALRLFAEFIQLWFANSNYSDFFGFDKSIQMMPSCWYRRKTHGLVTPVGDENHHRNDNENNQDPEFGEEDLKAFEKVHVHLES